MTTTKLPILKDFSPKSEKIIHYPEIIRRLSECLCIDELEFNDMYYDVWFDAKINKSTELVDRHNGLGLYEVDFYDVTDIKIAHLFELTEAGEPVKLRSANDRFDKSLKSAIEDYILDNISKFYNED